jgi:hypothetical protein
MVGHGMVPEEDSRTAHHGAYCSVKTSVVKQNSRLPGQGPWYTLRLQIVRGIGVRGLYHGKGGERMCFSPCFMQATRGAFVQRRLWRCRTCGSQAFQVIDCCRHPDYAPVTTAPVLTALKHWLKRLRAHLPRPQLPHRRPVRRVSPEGLDAWETRPLVIGELGRTRRPAVGDTNDAAARATPEMIAAGR